jgi:hypothetical protein
MLNMEDETEYNKLTYDKLNNLLTEIFKNDDRKDQVYLMDFIEDDGVPWRDQIKTGYGYYIGGLLSAYTGSGGAIAFGEALEKEGLSNAQIKESIIVTDSKTGKSCNLNKAKWKKI